MTDFAKLRELAESHSNRLGFLVADLTEWRLHCAPQGVLALLDEIERLNSLLTGRAARDASYAEADFEAVAENIAADPRWANRADSQRVARWALRQRRALAATQAALDEVTAARDELATMLEPIANYEMSGTARRETLDRISQLRAAGRVK